MKDIFYQVELGRIKKRYGDLVSINAEQTAGFDFVPVESYTAPDGLYKKIFAVWNRDDLTEEEKPNYPLMSEIVDGKTVVPSSLFARDGAYTLTVISWNQDNDESMPETYEDIPVTSSFRSTEEYRDNILKSGFNGHEYSKGYGTDIFGFIKSLIRNTFTTEERIRIKNIIDEYITEHNLQEIGHGEEITEETSMEDSESIIDYFIKTLLNYYKNEEGYRLNLYYFLHDHLMFNTVAGYDQLTDYISENGAGTNLVESLKSDSARKALLEPVLTNVYNLIKQTDNYTGLWYKGNNTPANVAEFLSDDYDETNLRAQNAYNYLGHLVKLAAAVELFLTNQFEADIDITGGDPAVTMQNAYDYIKSSGNFSGAGATQFLNALKANASKVIPIITAINNHFDTSIPTDSTAAQVAVSVAAIPSYSEGYSAAKAEDKPKTDMYDMFKTIYEQGSNMLSILTNTNGIDVLYSVPYINTRNMTTRAYVSPYIQSCGFDLTSAPHNFLIVSDSIFKIASELRHIKITNAHTQNDFSNLFLNLKNLESVELYGFNGYGTGLYGNGGMFRGCTGLTSINFVNGVCTEELNFTGCADQLSFYECNSLTNVRFVKGSIQQTFGFASCAMLSEDSVLSIINGLDETQTGQAIRFHATVKGEMNNWYAKYNSALDKYVSCPSTDEEATSFSSIVALKNWTLG